MMDITPIVPEGKQVIESYGDGIFTVTSVRHNNSIVVLPGKVFPWLISDAKELNRKNISVILENKEEIEILLLGTGKNLQNVNSEIIAILKQADISCDVMDSGAACRTYNVLLAEERKVAAELIAI